MIKVEQSAQPLGFVNHPALATRARIGEGDDIGEPLMIAFVLMVGQVLLSSWRREHWPKRINRSRHSSFGERSQRWAKALRLGDWGGSLRGGGPRLRRGRRSRRPWRIWYRGRGAGTSKFTSARWLPSATCNRTFKTRLDAFARHALVSVKIRPCGLQHDGRKVEGNARSAAPANSQQRQEVTVACSEVENPRNLRRNEFQHDGLALRAMRNPVCPCQVCQRVLGSCVLVEIRCATHRG
jgi:hypothetical protein